MQSSHINTKCFSFFTTILFVSLLLSSCDKKIYNSVRSYSISDKQIERLKSQTVLLVLPASEYDNIGDYKALLPTAWTLTPIEVIKYSDLSNITDPAKYALFSIQGLQSTTYSTAGSSSSYTSTHFYLTLSSYFYKKNKLKSDDFCRVELYPDFKSITYTFSRNAKVNNDRLYTQASIRNFSLPYMLAYLRFMQKNIENKNSPTVYKEYTDDALRSQLAGSTLYIPDNLVHNRNMFTGKETAKDDNFFSSYKGRYKIVSTKELVEMIKTKTDKKPLFLFEYVLTSAQKFVSVLEVTSGTVVYRRYQGTTYNLKTKDIERILN